MPDLRMKMKGIWERYSKKSGCDPAGEESYRGLSGRGHGLRWR